MKQDLFKNTYRKNMPLTDDYVFHSVFGRDTDESRAALMEILNIILGRKQDPIRFIIIKNPIEPGTNNAEKETIMDIKAETDSGEELDIEMQTGKLTFYPDRALFYGGRLVNSSLLKSEEYDKMKKSIVVSIINGTMFPELAGCHNIFNVREKNTGLLLSDKLEFHFIELSKVSDEKPIEFLSEIEMLAAYIKYASDEDKQSYIEKILSAEDITMTENVYRKLTQDEIEYERMEARMKYRLQYNTDVSQARKEGIKEGEIAGRAAAVLEMAKVMKRNGEALDKISVYTGLSAKEIEDLDL